MTIVNYDWDDLEDNIVEEYDETGATLAEYTTEPSQFGNVISQRRNGQDSYYHYDVQGSTLALTDASGDVTDTYAYSAFGEVTAHIGSTVNPFLYIGQKGYYRDSETGDDDVRRRPLKIPQGRWLASDPSAFKRGSLAPFIYSRNNPLNYYDPSGLAEKGNCSQYHITFLLPKATPWKTADFPKFEGIVLEGLTTPETWYIECKCINRRCIDVQPAEAVGWFNCPPKTARLCCDIVLNIPFILISAAVDEALREGIWGHEMYHVKNYQTKTKEVWDRLGKSQNCLPQAECDALKVKTLDDVSEELEDFSKKEQQHKNFPIPKPGPYKYPPPPAFPKKPIGHEPKPF